MKKNGGMVLLFCSQEALSQLRGVSSGGYGRTSESIETLQSRARELEKKVCVCVILTKLNYFFNSFFNQKEMLLYVFVLPTKCKCVFLS